jgi:hypothetical protein
LAQGAASTVLTNDGAGVLSWASVASTGWATTGNALTGGSSTTPNEFIGSTNAYDWVVKTSNTERMRVVSSGGIIVPSASAIWWGTASPSNITATSSAFTFNLGNSLPVGLNSGGGGPTFGPNQKNTTAQPGYDFSLLAGRPAASSADQNGGTLALIGGTSQGTGSSNIIFQTSASGSTGTAANTPTTKMTILGSGNVGIGTTTAANKLQVAGQTTIGNSNTISDLPATYFRTNVIGESNNISNSTGNGFGQNQWDIYGSSNTLTFNDNGARIGHVLGNSNTIGQTIASQAAAFNNFYIVGESNILRSTSSSKNLMAIGFNNVITNLSTVVIGNGITASVDNAITIGWGAPTVNILSSGFVGIGITSPIAPLHAYGGTSMTSGYNRTAVFHATHPTIQFKGISDSNHSGFIGYDAQLSSEAMRFWVGGTTDDAAANAVLAMSIRSNGNVGIGTASPTETLDVNGTISGNYQGFSYYTAGAAAPTSWNAVIIATLDYNTFGGGTYNTGTGTFTAPKTGYYRFMLGGYTTAATATNDRYAVGIAVNGVLRAFGGGQFSLADSPEGTFTHVVYLTSGKTVQPMFFNSLGASINLGSGAAGHQFWFQGEFLGK